MAFLRNLMGSVLKFIYEGVASILPNEPSSISYLAIICNFRNFDFYCNFNNF